jgi:hypothetical protein
VRILKNLNSKIQTKRRIAMNQQTDEFCLSVISLALTVKQILESGLIQEGMKGSISEDFRKLARKVRAAHKVIELNKKRATKCEPLGFRDSHLEGGKRICGTNQQKNSSKSYLSYMRQRQLL